MKHIPEVKLKLSEDIHLNVIIPFFNGKKYLKKCLDSIKIQTYKNYSVIVIDDASTELGIRPRKYNESLLTEL